VECIEGNIDAVLMVRMNGLRPQISTANDRITYGVILHATKPIPYI